MNSKIVVLLSALACLPLFAETPDDAIKLVQSDVTEEVLETGAQHQNSPLSAQDILEMKDAKVSDCINPVVQSVLGLPEELLIRECRKKFDEIQRRKSYLRGLVTDDGICTGLKMTAVLKFLRKQQPSQLIAAVPVAYPAHLEEIQQWCDRVVCLYLPDSFHNIEQFYQNFRKIINLEVLELLKTPALA